MPVRKVGVRTAKGNQQFQILAHYFNLHTAVPPKRNRIEPTAHQVQPKPDGYGHFPSRRGRKMHEGFGRKTPGAEPHLQRRAMGGTRGLAARVRCGSFFHRVCVRVSGRALRVVQHRVMLLAHCIAWHYVAITYRMVLPMLPTMLPKSVSDYDRHHNGPVTEPQKHRGKRHVDNVRNNDRIRKAAFLSTGNEVPPDRGCGFESHALRC